MVYLFLHSPIGCGVECKPSVPSARFDPVITTVQRLQTHALSRTVTGIGLDLFHPIFCRPTTIGSLLRVFPPFRLFFCPGPDSSKQIDLKTLSHGFSNKLDQISSDQLFRSLKI